MRIRCAKVRPVSSTSSDEKQRIALCDGAWVDLWPALVRDDQAWLDRLRSELPLAPERYRIVGREVMSPRLVSYHGDANASYRYSGALHRPTPWSPALTQLKAVVEAATGLTFNAVLVNLYRDGADGMGWHADDEPEIGPTPDDRWVASLSLGATRRFLLQHRRTKAQQAFALGEGALLVMRGATQTHYRHRLAKTKRPVAPRLNLTFRVVSAAHERAD